MLTIEDSSLNWTHVAQGWLTTENIPEQKNKENENLPSHSTPNHNHINRSKWLLPPREVKILKGYEKTDLLANIPEVNITNAINCSHLKTKCTFSCTDLNIIKTLFEVNPLQPDATYTVGSQISSQYISNAYNPLNTANGQGELKSVNTLLPTNKTVPQFDTASAHEIPTSKSSSGNLNSLYGNPAFSLPFCLPFSYATPIIPTLSAPMTT